MTDELPLPPVPIEEETLQASPVFLRGTLQKRLENQQPKAQ